MPFLGIAQDADGNVWIATSAGPEAKPPVPTQCAATTEHHSSITVPAMASPFRDQARSTATLGEHSGSPRRTVCCTLISVDFASWSTGWSRSRDGHGPGLDRRRQRLDRGQRHLDQRAIPGKLSRYNERERLVKVTRDDGLPGTSVSSLYLDADGSLLVRDERAPRSAATIRSGHLASVRGLNCSRSREPRPR